MDFMKKLELIIVVLPILFLGKISFSQNIVAKKGSFGIDETNKIIVWHHTKLDYEKENKKIESITFDKVYRLTEDVKQLSYDQAISLKNEKTYTLYLTQLPLIHISAGKLNSRKKVSGKFSYYDAGKYKESIIGIRHRGNLSLTFEKKSFDLEFWKDSITKKTKDLKFGTMRSDDDWVLDAMYNEPLRLRSYLATNLWTKIHEPYYLSKAPSAKSGFDVIYVEVFKNEHYYGVYQLSESIDRKQLQLEKNEGNVIKGKLYKADSYEGGPSFKKAPETYENLFPHWNGWRTEYPFLDYESDFEDLFKLQNLVVKSNDATFLKTISQFLNIDNAIDYYLFVNLIRASDNLGKNYYLGKYDKSEPYFIIPWDLDGTFGVVRKGEQVNKTEDILSNGLFDRLMKLNPNDYKTRVKLRWKTLREHVFSNDNLISRIDEIYIKFNEEKLYEREQLVWQNTLTETSNEAHYTYLKKWLEDRLQFLDLYFNGL